MREDDDIEDAKAVTGADEAAIMVRKYLQDIRRSSEFEGEVGLSLYHKGRTKDLDEPIEGFDFEATSNVEELVEEIVDTAVQYVFGMEAASVRFGVKAEGVVKRMIAFTLRMPKGEDDYDDMEDPPTRKGIVGQLMRHHHVEHTDIRRERRENRDMLVQLLDKKEKYIEQLERSHLATIAALEELSSGKHVRDIELRRMESGERRKDQVAGVLMNAAPILVGKLMGGDKAAAKMATEAPGGRTVVEQMLEGLIASFSNEQLQKIQESGVFSMEQLMALREIILYVMSKREAEEEARQKAANGKTAEQPAQTPAG